MPSEFRQALELLIDEYDNVEMSSKCNVNSIVACKGEFRILKRTFLVY